MVTNQIRYNIARAQGEPHTLTIYSVSDIRENESGESQFDAAAEALADAIARQSPGGFCDALAAALIRRVAITEV